MKIYSTFAVAFALVITISVHAFAGNGDPRISIRGHIRDIDEKTVQIVTKDGHLFKIPRSVFLPRTNFHPGDRIHTFVRASEIISVGQLDKKH